MKKYYKYGFGLILFVVLFLAFSSCTVQRIDFSTFTVEEKAEFQAQSAARTNNIYLDDGFNYWNRPGFRSFYRNQWGWNLSNWYGDAWLFGNGGYGIRRPYYNNIYYGNNYNRNNSPRRNTVRSTNARPVRKVQRSNTRVRTAPVRRPAVSRPAPSRNTRVRKNE